MVNTIRMPVIMKNTVIVSKETGERRNGKIIDETRNTFRILIEGELKTITKNNHIFMFNEEGKQIEIDGKIMERRAEDRTTKKSK